MGKRAWPVPWNRKAASSLGGKKSETTTQRGPSETMQLKFSWGKAMLRLQMNIICLLFAFALCAAPTLLAQEYKIQMQRLAKADQQFELSCRLHETHRVSATFLGRQSPESKTNYVAELDGLMKVLETDSNGKITKASCTISNCVRVEDKFKRELLPRETVVIATAEKGKAEFRVHDKLVDAEAQRILAMGMQVNEDEATTEEIYGTDQPKKVGDSWDINPEYLARMLKAQKLGITNPDIQGRTTLEQVVKVGDIDCLELASKVYLKKFTPPLPAGVQVKQAFGAIRLTGKLPLDVSMGALEQSMDVDVTFVAQVNAGTNAVGVTTKTISAIKATLLRKYLK